MTDITFTADIEFIEDNDEAFASVSTNPNFSWAKIRVCDAIANANKQRIPVEEFDNLVKTGMYAPIKIAPKQISNGHVEAFDNPIGTITQMKRTDSDVHAIAALWKREKKTEVDLLKEMYASGKLPQVSWELYYDNETVDEEGVKDLHGVELNALVIVGMPAYKGRTPIYAIASQEDDTLEEELKKEIETLKAKVETLEAELETSKAEASALAQFKQEVEDAKAAEAAAKALEEKFTSIKTKFSEAGITKDETYFSEKKDYLLKLDDETLDFILQEMVSFASEHKSSDASDKGKVPNLKNTEPTALEPSAIVKGLKELKSKK